MLSQLYYAGRRTSNPARNADSVTGTTGGNSKFFIGGFKIKPLIFLLPAFMFIAEYVGAQGSAQHCKLNCRDTSFCFSVPDSAIHLVKPSYTSADPIGT